MTRKSRFAMVAALAALAMLGFQAAIAMPKKKRPPAKPIDLNRATVAQLEKIPGVGPVTASRIVEFRQKSGPFQRVEDLLAIHGISQRRLEKMRPYIVVRPSVKPQPGAGSHAAKKPPGKPGR